MNVLEVDFLGDSATRDHANLDDMTLVLVGILVQIFAVLRAICNDMADRATLFSVSVVSRTLARLCINGTSIKSQ